MELLQKEGAYLKGKISRRCDNNCRKEYLLSKARDFAPLTLPLDTAFPSRSISPRFDYDQRCVLAAVHRLFLGKPVRHILPNGHARLLSTL